MKQRSSCFPPTAVGPFWSNAAIIVHHANVDTLALPAELLRSVDREDHCLLTAAVWTQSVGGLDFCLMLHSSGGHDEPEILRSSSR